jgi:hypothetical protein
MMKNLRLVMKNYLIFFYLNDVFDLIGNSKHLAITHKKQYARWLKAIGQ